MLYFINVIGSRSKINFPGQGSVEDDEECPPAYNDGNTLIYSV